MAVDIPNYRVVEKLGVGASTRIFRARCMRTGKDYAVKIVKIVNPEDAGFIDLLRTEHAIGTTIDHPVIRKVYELRMLRRRLRVHGAILFMEYVCGHSMADKEFRADVDEILRIFIEAARGLQAMHQAGYVHADLKPNNIMIGPDGAVKMIDLGQSSRLNEAKTRVQGTIHYMAPEQVKRDVLDARTDVFGLGATLYKVLTGTYIETDMNRTIAMDSPTMIGQRATKADGTLLEELPVSIVRLIQDACQYDPDKRIPDMPTMIQRLELTRTILKRKATGAVEDADFDDEDADELDSAPAIDPIDLRGNAGEVA